MSNTLLDTLYKLALTSDEAAEQVVKLRSTGDIDGNAIDKWLFAHLKEQNLLDALNSESSGYPNSKTWAAHDLIVSFGGTIENFKKLAKDQREKSNPVLVYYSSDTCPHCTKFDALWSDDDGDVSDETIIGKAKRLYPGLRFFHARSTNGTGTLNPNKGPRALEVFAKWFPMLLVVPGDIWNRWACTPTLPSSKYDNRLSDISVFNSVIIDNDLAHNPQYKTDTNDIIRWVDKALNAEVYRDFRMKLPANILRITMAQQNNVSSGPTGPVGPVGPIECPGNAKSASRNNETNCTRDVKECSYTKKRPECCLGCTYAIIKGTNQNCQDEPPIVDYRFPVDLVKTPNKNIDKTIRFPIISTYDNREEEYDSNDESDEDESDEDSDKGEILNVLRDIRDSIDRLVMLNEHKTTCKK